MKHLKSAIYYNDGSTYYDNYSEMNEHELKMIEKFKFKIGDHVKLYDIPYTIVAVSPDSHLQYKIECVNITRRVKEDQLN